MTFKLDLEHQETLHVNPILNLQFKSTGRKYRISEFMVKGHLEFVGCAISETCFADHNVS